MLFSIKVVWLEGFIANLRWKIFKVSIFVHFAHYFFGKDIFIEICEYLVKFWTLPFFLDANPLLNKFRDTLKIRVLTGIPEVSKNRLVSKKQYIRRSYVQMSYILLMQILNSLQNFAEMLWQTTYIQLWVLNNILKVIVGAWHYNCVGCIVSVV